MKEMVNDSSGEFLLFNLPLNVGLITQFTSITPILIEEMTKVMSNKHSLFRVIWLNYPKKKTFFAIFLEHF